MSQTGRHLIFFHNGAIGDVAAAARDLAGMTMASSVEEAESATMAGAWREDETVVVPSLNVAITAASREQLSRLDAGGRSAIRRIRPEYVFSIATGETVDARYVRGYRDGVSAFAAAMLAQSHQSDDGDLLTADNPAFTDSAELTWGLQAVALPKTQLSGRGVRVAVLDTGVDLTHPDFKDRGITTSSFVPGTADADDDNGHGTHCLGTLAGPTVPQAGPRYGVASSTEVLVGKVLNAGGKGREGDILHGIGWALQHGCRVISMSFGKRVAAGTGPDADYDEIGAIALSKNCLLVAAAGNNSMRPNEIDPVAMPANAKTFMAVGAINRRLELYPKCNGGLNANGGNIDLVAPGVDVRSSKPLSIVEYGLASGTSMATPHVAGIAALMMEADSSASAEQIWTRLTQNARRLPLPNIDVGAGLAQVG